MFRTSKVKITRPKPGFWMAHPYILSSVEFFIGEASESEVLQEFEDYGFFPLEEDTDPTLDVMHFYRFDSKEEEKTEGMFYLVQSIPDVDIAGNNIIYVVSINCYCDKRGSIGDDNA